jgi:riboflavin kinase/FMN adenylyltransferase
VKVYANFPHELPADATYPVVTLGVFDGVHVGHQKILATALEKAQGRPVAVVTFDPHPRAVLGPPKRARLLSPLAERLELLARWPIAAVPVLRFDQAIAATHYREFVQRWLVQGLGAEHLVLGWNMHVGHDREGDQQRLEELSRQLGFALTTVPAVEVGGEPVSSTRIRHLLDQGDVEAASTCLGRPYGLSGTVVRGTGRGRVMGTPTANLSVDPEKLVPANGVYAVWVRLGRQRYQGAMNLGVAPTLRDDQARLAEVHLLDYTGDLYGAVLQLEMIARIRDERRFDSADALVAQIRADVEAVRTRLGSS